MPREPIPEVHDDRAAMQVGEPPPTTINPEYADLTQLDYTPHEIDAPEIDGPDLG